MSAAIVIFPHQLYPNHPALEKGNVVYMVETDLYFTQYTFHISKLVLLRMSMQRYAEKLIKNDKNGLILEAGCGNGRLLQYYHNRGFQIVGIDFISSSIKKLKDKDDSLNVFEMRIDKMNFPNKMYLDGAQVSGTETTEVFNPATEEKIVTVASASLKEVEIALLSAKKAFQKILA